MAFFRKKGFQVGTEVCKRAVSNVVYVISHVRRSEGESKEFVVDLKPHLGHAEGEQPVLGLNWSGFSEEYHLASAAALGEVVLAEGWPAKAAHNKVEVLSIGALRGFVLAGVREVAAALAEASSYKGKVEPRTNPVRGAFATQAVDAAGRLHIPPETPNVAFLEEETAAQKEAEGSTLPGVAVQVLKAPAGVPPGRVYLVSKNSAAYQAVFYHVRTTPSPEEANMAVEYHTVSAVAVVEHPHGSVLHARRDGKQPEPLPAVASTDKPVPLEDASANTEGPHATDAGKAAVPRSPKG